MSPTCKALALTLTLTFGKSSASVVFQSILALISPWLYRTSLIIGQVRTPFSLLIGIRSEGIVCVLIVLVAKTSIVDRLGNAR